MDSCTHWQSRPWWSCRPARTARSKDEYSGACCSWIGSATTLAAILTAGCTPHCYPVCLGPWTPTHDWLQGCNLLTDFEDLYHLAPWPKQPHHIQDSHQRTPPRSCSISCSLCPAARSEMPRGRRFWLPLLVAGGSTTQPLEAASDPLLFSFLYSFFANFVSNLLIFFNLIKIAPTLP